MVYVIYSARLLEAQQEIKHQTKKPARARIHAANLLNDSLWGFSCSQGLNHALITFKGRTCWTLLPCPLNSPGSYIIREKSQLLWLQIPWNSCERMSRIKSLLLLKGTGNSLNPRSPKTAQKKLIQGGEKQGAMSVISDDLFPMLLAL